MNGLVGQCSTFVDTGATIPLPNGEHLNVFPGYWSEIIPDMKVITVQGILEKTQAKAASEVGSLKVRRPAKTT